MQTVCCLFGQQEVPRQEWGIIQKRLEREMKMLYGRGVTVFAAGSWSDFGWIAAATAIKLKGELPDVQLWLVNPPDAEKEVADRPDVRYQWERLEQQADRLVRTPPNDKTRETDWIDRCMQADGYCLCYVRETTAIRQWMENWRAKGVTVENLFN